MKWSDESMFSQSQLKHCCGDSMLLPGNPSRQKRFTGIYLNRRMAETLLSVSKHMTWKSSQGNNLQSDFVEQYPPFRNGGTI